MSEERPSADPEKKTRLAEDVFIILCILSLWPVILGWREPVYEFLLYVALAGLVVVFFRRLRRFQRARDELEDQ